MWYERYLSTTVTVKVTTLSRQQGWGFLNSAKTSMHSSRMHTACLLIVSKGVYIQGCLPNRWGPASGGLPNPRGSASRRVCSTPGGFCIWGVCPIQGVCMGGSAQPRGVFLGGSSSRGVCIQGGSSQGVSTQPPQVYLQGGGWADPPPPPLNRMTHRCKTLPCPKLRLRAVTSFTLKHIHDTVVANSNPSNYH